MKKRIVNELKMSFPSLSENERFSRLAVSGFLSQLNPQVDELSDIKTAVSEGVTNCIVHGYRNTIGLIYMQIRIFDGGKIYIKIAYIHIYNNIFMYIYITIISKTT